MKLALAVTFLLAEYQQSEAFLSKLGSVGTAMKALSSSLFSKPSEEPKPTATAGAPEGDLMEQMEFMNSMMKKVHAMFLSPSSRFLQKAKPVMKMMCDFVLPNFDQLNFPDHILEINYKMSPDKITKYKMLFFETRKMLHSLKDSNNM